MVWLHGGAFAYGSGNRAVTDGANLARRGDVVVVSVNHRLNICGYLHLEDIGGERFAGSGNAGSLDMIAALEWVRDNIGQFGGDAGNVTIFGESGGGGKVSALLVMPAAKGLFHRAVIQSGAAVRFTTRERANALAGSVVKRLGGIDRLADVPLAALLDAIIPASKEAGPRAWPLLDRYDFGPVVDGAAVIQHPAEPTTSPLGDDHPVDDRRHCKGGQPVPRRRRGMAPHAQRRAATRAPRRGCRARKPMRRSRFTVGSCPAPAPAIG